MSENDAAGWPNEVEMSEDELQTICDAIRFGLNLHGETSCTYGETCLGVKRHAGAKNAGHPRNPYPGEQK